METMQLFTYFLTLGWFIFYALVIKNLRKYTHLVWYKNINLNGVVISVVLLFLSASFFFA